MKFLKKIEKNFFFYFVILFLITGIYFSLQTGITHDEQYDLYVWQANQNLFLNKIFAYDLDTSYLKTGASMFYGSGFHIISLPIEFIIQKLNLIPDYDEETKILLSKHATVFIFYIVSGLFLRQILKTIINNKSFANIGCIFYLLYPYLLGHSFFNVKDIPFLSIWLICTYLIIKIFKIFVEKNTIKNKNLYLLSLFTAYLLSIRISGVLIFFQYLIFIIVSLNYSNMSISYFFQKFFKKIIFASIIFIIFFLLIQPNYWENPLQIVDAIKFMSQHIQTVCTITLGNCMKAQDLPASYIPIWLSFKLPIIVLIGFFFYPFVEKKIEKKSFKLAILNSLIISSSVIIFSLILFEVNLYDEIRQIMFIVPILIIISLSLIYLHSKKFYLFSLSFFIIFFVIQNLKIYPYNYIWINNLSHLTKINDVFELDYWGVASRPSAEFLSKNSSNINECIITIRSNGIKPFVNENQCILNLNQLHKKIKRPFYVSLTERSLKKGVPNNCNLTFIETKKINFSNEVLTLAKVFKCD